MIKLHRKLWRLLGLVFPILYIFLTREWMTGIVAVVFVLVLAFDIYRIKHRGFNRKLFKKYSFLLKDNERESVTSVTWFMLSVLITVLFFPKTLAILAIIFADLGTIAAVIAGVLFGKFAKGYKNVEGSLGMLIVCVAVGLIFWGFGFVTLGIMLVGAFAATLTELFTPGPYDNLTIAVVAAIVMSLV